MIRLLKEWISHPSQEHKLNINEFLKWSYSARKGTQNRHGVIVRQSITVHCNVFAIKSNLWNPYAAKIKPQATGRKHLLILVFSIYANPQRISRKSNDTQLSPTHHACSGMLGNTHRSASTFPKCSPGSESKSKLMNSMRFLNIDEKKGNRD